MRAAPVVFLALAACGGKTAATTGSGLGDAGDPDAAVTALLADTGAIDPSVERACFAQATALCALRDSCTGGVENQVTYGGTSLCIDRQAASCIANLRAPQTSNSAAHVEACAAAYPGESCVALWDDDPVTACRTVPGPRANGATCGVSAQCESTFCFIGANAACGTCQPVPKAGDACQTSGQCQYDLDCPVVAPATSGVCTPRGSAGAACGDLLPCQGGLACIGADAATGVTGTCQPGSTSLGTPCNYAAGGTGCDSELYLGCEKGASGTFTCQHEPLATGGEACGSLPTGYAQCTAGATCVKLGTSTTGTCSAAAGTGEACDSVNGPPCLSPAKCIASSDGGASGTCVFPDPTTCG